MAQAYVFIVGCPRSGTTEFTYLLNVHDDICLGAERYLYLYPKLDKPNPPDFDQARFKMNRFANVLDGETFYRDIAAMPCWSSTFYGGRPMAEKWDSARIVGDKAPVALFYVAELAKRFPDAVFVVIVRDILSVCRSWQKRADDERDALWSRSDGFAVAVEKWLSYIRHGMILQKSGLRIIQVYTPSMYEPGDGQIGKVLDFLGVDSNPSFEDVLARRRRHNASRAAAAPPSEEERRLTFNQKSRINHLIKTWHETGSRLDLDKLFWAGFSAELGVESQAPSHG